MKFAGLLVAVGLLAGAGPAAADPITVIYSSRSALAIAQIQDPYGSPHDVQFEHDADNLSAHAQAFTSVSLADATASLQSSLGDPAHLSAMGLATAFLDTTLLGNAGAQADYFVGMRLDRPYQYDFTGRFDGTGSTALWQVQLVGSGAGLLQFNRSGTEDALVQESGLLPAGNWYLHVLGGATGSLVRSRLQYAAALDLTPAAPAPAPTPEPASLLLFGTGTAGAIAARRRR